MDTETKNQFDAINELCKGAWEQFNERRRFEFKVCIAVWTALSAFIALILTGRLIESSNSIFVIIGTSICVILITVFHSIWIRGLGKANSLDRNIAIHYERFLQKITNTNFPIELENKLKGPRDKMGKLIANWSHRAQIGVTITLAIASILAVCYSSINMDKKTTSEKHPCCCHPNHIEK